MYFETQDYIREFSGMLSVNIDKGSNMTEGQADRSRLPGTNRGQITKSTSIQFFHAAYQITAK